MKPEIHPDYHAITVVMTDGTEFTTRSTWGKTGDRLSLDVDPKTHPAWTGLHRAVDRGTQLAKFNKRFGGLTAKKEPEAAEASAALEAKSGEKIKLTTTVAKPAKAKKKA